MYYFKSSIAKLPDISDIHLEIVPPQMVENFHQYILVDGRIHDTIKNADLSLAVIGYSIRGIFNSLIVSPNMLASTMLHTMKNTTCTNGCCSNLDFHLIYKDGHGSVSRSNTTITTNIHKYDLTLGLFNFFVLNYIYTYCYFVRLRYVHNFNI